MKTELTETRLAQLCEECTNSIRGFMHEDSDFKKQYDSKVLEIEKQFGPTGTSKKLTAYFEAMETALRAENHPIPQTLQTQVKEAAAASMQTENTN